MNNLERVSPWTIEEARRVPYDLLIASLGYEKRARFVSESSELISNRKVALGFGSRKLYSYRINHRWFSQHDFEIMECSDPQFRSQVARLLRDLRNDPSKPLRVCVDISSMSRFRIACTVAEVQRSGISAVVDFVYATAKYAPPAREMAQIESAGPVLNEFAGWSSDPQMPAAAIFGLGYEYDKAIGALDYIEPAQTWAFQATSHDSRYDRETHRANQFLWGELPPARRLTYLVSNPFDTFMDIESLVFGVSRYYRPVLIPFGPKVFTLCCLLVALVHKPLVAVWRVTSGIHETPIDRAADGSYLGLRATFTPSKAISVVSGTPIISPEKECGI